MYRDIYYGEEARQKIKAGVDKLANVVKVTLGPKGRNVIIGKGFGAQNVTKDGVTVAKSVKLKDPVEAIGANMILEVATKTNSSAGDGTTTATVLAQAMVSEGLKNVTAGANPIALRSGMQKALKTIVERLKGLSVPVSGQMIAKVAGISANDQQIGDLIGEAMEKLGEHGILTVDESRGQEMELEVVKGLQWDNGFISPYMVTDLATMKCELENPLVLVSDKKFSSAEDLLPFLEESASTGNKNLLIVCEDVTDQALGLAVVNKMKGIMNILCVKVHGFGSRKKANLEDIAIVCGAKLHASEMDIEFKISKDIFGTCDKVISAKDKTTIIGGKGDVKDRILQVQNELKTAGADFDKDRIKERLAKLEGGVGIIRVGAASEIEMVEKKYRVEDAINAARASVEEGIVTGAGTALFECGKLKNGLVGDEKIGFEIVRLACSRPAYLIAQNAGHDGAVILAELLKKPLREGFDSEKGEWVDLIEVGIIDPTKVVRCALENAVSVASTILTTEAVMVEIEERLASSGS